LDLSFVRRVTLKRLFSRLTSVTKPHEPTQSKDLLIDFTLFDFGRVLLHSRDCASLLLEGYKSTQKHTHVSSLSLSLSLRFKPELSLSIYRSRLFLSLDFHPFCMYIHTLCIKIFIFVGRHLYVICACLLFNPV
jgi:hypothetical protein